MYFVMVQEQTLSFGGMTLLALRKMMLRTVCCLRLIVATSDSNYSCIAIRCILLKPSAIGKECKIPILWKAINRDSIEIYHCRQIPRGQVVCALAAKSRPSHSALNSWIRFDKLKRTSMMPIGVFTKVEKRDQERWCKIFLYLKIGSKTQTI